MKRIILSFVTIAAVAALAVGGTFAVFSATDSIEGNTISTATVEIDAKGEQQGEELPKPINASGLVPGERTQWYRGAVWNKSDVPLKIYMYVTDVTGDACGKTNLTVWTGHASGGGDDERARQVYPINENEEFGPVNGLKGANNRVELTGIPPFELLEPNITQILQQRAQLDPSANNNHMDAGCTWTEVFVGETVEPEDNEA